MARLSIEPPKPFNFSNPDDWPRWKKRFQQFREASGLSAESQKRQVSTLLYCLGEDADDVLVSTSITEEARKSFDTVVEKFDNHFQVRQNLIFERAKFNKRVQLESESAEQFITALYHLADTCNYGEMKSEMIRDRLVVGIRDENLSQQLQTDSELTLDKAKKKIRQKEAVHQQHDILKGRDVHPSSDLEGIKYKSKHASSIRKNDSMLGTSKKCTRCGKAKHPRDKCPARDAECFNCHKKGHYSSLCLSKKTTTAVFTIQGTEQTNASETESDDKFLGAIESQQETQWISVLKVNNMKVTFKIDTGAEVSAINEITFNKLQDIQLKKPQKLLYGPAMSPLTVLGQFTANLTYNHVTCKQKIFVVKGLKNNLLGLPAITSLSLISRMSTVHYNTHEVKKNFSHLFQGLGSLGNEYEIHLKEDAKPVSLHTARNIPLPLRGKVQQELKRMESMGVISPVTEPSPWCSGMVVVPKPSGQVRICVDLKKLNECVQREFHPLPHVEEILAQLTGAQVFTKLDANSGFWQIPLARKSCLLTTFITPFGRYNFNKLPFGITSAPELFQRRMSAMLSGLSGVLCLMDDVLIFGKDQAEHDDRLIKVLKRIESTGVTLNVNKCEFSKSEVKFLGHIINKEGVKADPAKTRAILDMQPPQNVPEMRRFIGMTNQLSKFIPCSAELMKPLTELLSSKRSFQWGPNQSKAFDKIKETLTKPSILTLYDPAADTKVSADASSFGLGAVILQRTEAIQPWKPVAYASRTMTDTETHYAQIEKEALALTWACERFSMYLLGKSFLLETDHKPLVSLLSSKNLDNLPPRILRFRLRMMRYNFTIIHVPGKALVIADALSRAPVHSEVTDPPDLQESAEAFISAIVEALPASASRLEQIAKAQSTDPILQQVKKHCQEGWPASHLIKGSLKAYWGIRSELSMHNNLLLRAHRIVIPTCLQQDTLSRIHEGHQGIGKCRSRARTSVWWPGISQQIKEMIQKCHTCCKNFQIRSEPLIPSTLPQRPWEKIGTDLFELKGKSYLLLVDYFSRYIEVIKLSSTTTSSIVTAMKPIFARYGIPNIVISDNGPQYSSQEFQEFAKAYDFEHITSSPYHPQGNGEAERAVKTVKNLLRDTSDPNLALLSYRSTPLSWCGHSPAELLMGRQIRSTLPISTKSLTPRWPDLQTFRTVDEQFKQKQKKHFDRRHRATELPTFSDDEPVFVTTARGSASTPGRILQTPRDRSYEVQTSSGVVRRNRSYIHSRPEESGTSEVSDPENNPTNSGRSPVVTRLRSGTPIQPPDRLTY